MKYVQLPDIRHLATWKNPNAARLYMYMLMSATGHDHGYYYSRRWTCKEIGITEDAYRHAINVLEKDGLIRKAPPKKHPREHPSQHPKDPPHITVVPVNELYNSNPPSNTPSSTPSSTPENAHNVRKNKIINLTHPRVREVLRSSIQDLMDYCHINKDMAMNALHSFAAAMNAKGKTWEDPDDAKQHLMDWTLKHYLREKSVETAARTEEQRLEYEQKLSSETTPAQDAQDKIAYRLSHLMACVKNETSRHLVTSWHQAGVWYDEELRKYTQQAFDANPGLRDEIIKALGFDVLRQGTLHID